MRCMYTRAELLVHDHGIKIAHPGAQLVDQDLAVFVLQSVVIAEIQAVFLLAAAADRLDVGRRVPFGFLSQNAGAIDSLKSPNLTAQ